MESRLEGNDERVASTTFYDAINAFTDKKWAAVSNFRRLKG